MEYLNLMFPPECHAFYSSSLVKKGEYHYLMEDRWALHCYFGKGELTIAGETRSLEPGMVSITPAGSASLYRLQGDFNYIYSHFTPQGLEVTHSLPRFITPEKELIDLIKQGGAEFPHAPCLGRAILWQILLSIGQKEDGENIENPHSWVGRARKQIAGNLFAPFSLSSLSHDLGLSSAQLNRLFKRERGTTVYQYVIEERMKRIEYFITQTEISLKQIALEAGYNDLQKFNKHCRKYLGHSPRELRNKIKAENVTTNHLPR